jgi:hypothetical protein
MIRRTVPPGWTAVLAWACASAGAAAPPPGRADGAAADVCRRAVEAVRAQAGYTARYEATIHKKGSDPFTQKGDAVRQGDLFYREGRREAEKEPSVRLYRLKDRVAVYDARGDQWLSAGEAGDPALGQGLEDPDAAMAFLLEAMEGAEAGPSTEEVGGVACRPYRIGLDKKKVARKVQEQYEAAKNLDWEKAEVNAQVLVGGDPALPRRFRINGVLPGQNADDGVVTLHIEVQITGYGAVRPLEVPPDAKPKLGIP